MRCVARLYPVRKKKGGHLSGSLHWAWALGCLPPTLRTEKKNGNLVRPNEKNPYLPMLVAKAVNFFLFPLVSFPFNQKHHGTAAPIPPLSPSLWVTCRLLFIFLPVIESVSSCHTTSLFRLRSIAIDRYSPPLFVCCSATTSNNTSRSKPLRVGSSAPDPLSSDYLYCSSLRSQKSTTLLLAFCSPAYSPNPNLSLSFLPHDRDLH